MARDLGTIQVPRPKGGNALILGANQASGKALRYRPRKPNPRPEPLDLEILNYEPPRAPKPKLRPLAWYSSRELQRKDVEYRAPKYEHAPALWAPGPRSFYQDQKQSFNRGVSPPKTGLQSQSSKSRWAFDEEVNFILPRSSYVPPTPYVPRVSPITKPLRVDVEQDYPTSRYSSSSSSSYSSLLSTRPRPVSYFSDLQPIEYPAPRARKYAAPAYKSLYLDLDEFKYTPPKPSYIPLVSRPLPRSLYEDLDTYEYTPPKPMPSYGIIEYKAPTPRYVPLPRARPSSYLDLDLDTYEYTPYRPRPRYDIIEYTAPRTYEYTPPPPRLSYEIIEYKAPKPRYVPPPRARPSSYLDLDLDTYEYTPEPPRPRPRYDIIEYKAPTTYQYTPPPPRPSYEIIEYKAPKPRYVPPPPPRPSSYLDLALFEYTPPKPSYIPSVYKSSSNSFFNSDLKAISEYTPPRPQYEPIVYTPQPRPKYEAISYTPTKPRYTPPVYKPSSYSILDLDQDVFEYKPPKPSYIPPVPKASSWYSDVQYTQPTVRYEPAPPARSPRPSNWYSEPEPVVRKVPPKPVHGSVVPVSWMSESDHRASTRVSKMSPTDKSTKTYNYDDGEPHGRGPKVLSVQVTVM
eukprot:GHVU01158571.1.p1 GENE.GHVU01158571.1~~GHVU01158571.1.p1  ORF type:complete len:626 (+),score=20.92 GHVU01158571.1:570-2447(+)